MEIQLIEDGEQVQLYRNLQKVSITLGELVEKSEQYMWIDTPKALTSLNKINSILQFIAQSLLVQEGIDMNASIDLSNQIQVTSNQPVFSIFPEGSFYNPFTQQLIKNQSIFKSVIDYVKFDADNFTFSRENNEKFDVNSETAKSLRLSYLILSRFAYKNPTNQSILLEYLETVFIKHLRTIPEADVHLLLVPLLTENAVVLFNESTLRRFLKNAVYTINKISPNSRLKPAYFDILTIVTKFKNRVIKSNQTSVINEISHRDYPSIVVTYSEPAKFNMFKNLVEDLDRKMQQNEAEITISPELDYFNGFMYLMSIICEDKNNATESKAQIYFKLDHLKLLMSIAKDNYYVKNNLIFFFYHVYLDTEREVTDELTQMKSSLIGQVQNDMKMLFSNEEHDSIVFLTYQGRKTYLQIKQIYFFESLLLVVESLIVNRMLENNMVDQFVNDLIDSLKQVRKHELKKYTTGFKSILGILLKYNLVGKKQLESMFPLDLLPGQEEQSQKVYVCKSEEIPHIKVSNDFQQAIESQLLTNQDLQEFAAKEFANLINIISNIENISMECLESKGTISTNEFLTTIINQIKNNDESTIENKILRSKILRKFIENAFSEEIKPAVQWAPESYNFIASKLKTQQKKLVQQGVVEMLVEVMKKDNSSELFREYLWLGVALLIGQNRIVQQQFIEQLELDEENSFLHNISSKINILFDDINKNMKIINKKRFNAMCNVKVDEIEGENEEEIQKNQEFREDDALFANKITSLSEIYQFLGMICDGHFQTAQVYLSEQKTQKSHDFILSSALQFSQFVKFSNIESIKLGQQLLDFMILSCQGPCFRNQQQLVKGKAIESCKELLMKFDSDGEFMQAGCLTQLEKIRMNEMVTNSSILLLALIEGGEDREIIDHMCLTLDFDFLFCKMKDEYIKLANTLGLTEDDITISNVTDLLSTVYSDQMLNVFCIMILILQLQNFNPEISELIDSYQTDNSKQGKFINQAISFFKSNTKSIEVLVNSKPVLVYFPVHPVCKYLSKSSRVKMMYDVPRDTTAQKVQYLINETESFIEEMDYTSFLQILPFYFSDKRFENVKFIATLLAYVICILMFSTYQKDFNSTYDKALNINSKQIQPVIITLSWIQFGFSLAIMVFYLFIKVPLLLKRRWREMVERNLKKYGEQPDLDQLNSEQISPMDLELSVTLRLLQMKGPDAAIFNQGIVRNMGNLFTFFFYYWKNIKFLFGEGEFNYFLFYIILSILARFYTELIYAFIMLDIINQVPTLQNVVKSVTNNASILCMIGVMVLILSYIYASIIYFFQNDLFAIEGILDMDGTRGLENECTTLWQCFCITLLNGLILGAGIGDYDRSQSYSEATRNKYYSKIAIDWSFFIIFKLILLTLIFSAIIETFRVLKEIRYAIEDDMSANCYVCGIERGQFEQFADGFDSHIERDHNAWNYVYYIYYVTKLKKSMRNGVESSVANKFQIKETNWMPLNKARCLMKREEGNAMKELEEILAQSSRAIVIKEEDKE